MKNTNVIVSVLCIFVMAGCTNTVSMMIPTQTLKQDVEIVNNQVIANILTVKVSGDPNAYQFGVEISSPDTGCDQYADWWEVLSEDGQLLYRRVLLHSHVDEQPFTRSGGPVPITSDAVVYVRAHMNTSRYGGSVLKGTVANGFKIVALESDFASEVESQQPLPEGCEF